MNMWKKLTAILLVIVLLVAIPVTKAEAAQGTGEAKLRELLDLASRLRENRYTSESWQALQDAMEIGNAALESGDAEAITNAVNAIALAIYELTYMDYTDLELAIAEAELFMQENEGQWPKLQEAIEAGRATFGCGDQAAVDQAAANIRACLEECRNPGVPTVVWIILAGVAVLAGAAAAVLIIRKKKGNRNKQVDDMPLVDYDIDDDIM